MAHSCRVLVLALWACSIISIGCGRPAYSPLAAAAARGDLTRIQQLVRDGAHVNGAPGELTPLIAAARDGRTDAISLLLSLGADVNQGGGVNGWTPVQHAIHTGHAGAARGPLDGGADVSGARGASALAMAAGYGDAGTVALLLTHGVDPRQHPDGAEAVLAEAVGGAWDIDYRWAGCAPHTAAARLLLDRVPGLALDDSFHARTALAYARAHGCDELVAMVGRGNARRIARRP